MTIEELCELVLSLRPNNFMGLNGAAAGVLGSTDSGSDAISQLQRATLEFAKTYKIGNDEAVKAAKKEVIGRTMVAVALDALTEEKADQIAETVTDITKGKK